MVASESRVTLHFFRKTKYQRSVPRCGNHESAFLTSCTAVIYIIFNKLLLSEFLIVGVFVILNLNSRSPVVHTFVCVLCVCPLLIRRNVVARALGGSFTSTSFD